MAARNNGFPALRLTLSMSLSHKISRWLGWEAALTTIAVGHAAPGFTLKSLDGKEYSLAKLLEKGPVVAAFFKISCPVCQFTFPYLQRLAEERGYAGRLVLLPDPELGPDDCRIEWADGGVVRDRASIEGRINEAVNRYLGRKERMNSNSEVETDR